MVGRHSVCASASRACDGSVAGSGKLDEVVRSGPPYEVGKFRFTLS